MKLIAKHRVQELLSALARDYAVWVPQIQEGVKVFSRFDGSQEAALGGANTVTSPKGVFFPQTEKMYEYEWHKLDVAVRELAPAAEKQVVVGIRPCDVKAIQLLDQAFLTKGYVDEFYRARRANTVIISLGCTTPQPGCFCDSWGINPAVAEGADVVMFDLGDRYGLEAKTDSGAEVLDAVKGFLSEGEAALPKVSCTLKVEVPPGLPEKLKKMFDHPLWGEICRRCLNCGLCTYICPTCHCFDIQSYNVGDRGFKYRCWDSCMFSEYTLMAGGHNPRPTKKERVRNRFLHKLQYYPERYGEFGCVGCGRCLVKCPVGMDITRLIARIREVDVDG